VEHDEVRSKMNKCTDQAADVKNIVRIPQVVKNALEVSFGKLHGIDYSTTCVNCPTN